MPNIKIATLAPCFYFFKLMTKIAILKKRIIRAYNNPENWRYSEFKGYPEGTYFGFETLNELITYTVNSYKEYYGKKLKYWKYI